jgi:hypothetical protein
MDLPALQTTINDLEKSLDSLESWLLVATLLVVVGLVLEYWHDIPEALAKLRNGWDTKSVLVIVGGILITMGVAGELAVQFFASRKETKLRRANDEMIGILNKQAADAKERTKQLELQIAHSTAASDDALKKVAHAEVHIVKIGEIFEDEARMRGGLRSGLEDLNKIVKSTADPDVLQIAKNSLQRATDEFDLRIQKERRAISDSVYDLLKSYLRRRPGPPPDINTAHGLITIINTETDLNCVAAVFETLKNYTGTNLKTFDFDAVSAWCSDNKPKCEAP